MTKEILTNEQKFIKDIAKVLQKKLLKYGLKDALLLLPDSEGQYKIQVNQPVTAEQLRQMPRA